MTQETEATRPELRWTGATRAPAGASGGALERFLGGSPGAVFVRLFFVSLVVGALLMWFDVRPWDIFRAIERLANRLWALGFDAVREVAAYVLAGAVIVVPVWFVLRLMNYGRAR